MGGSAALLREWSWLQERVVPEVLDRQSAQPPAALSIGSIEDAVSLAIAFRHGSSTTRQWPALYVDTSEVALDRSGFTRADLSDVPPESWRPLLVRHRSRWVADQATAEHIMVGKPPRPVDLLTVRSPRAGVAAAGDLPVGHLADGGHLLIIGSQAEPTTLPAYLEAVAMTPTGCLFRKVRALETSECAASLRLDDEAKSLARLRTEEELVASHVRLAASLARRFGHHGAESEDLHQVAMLALVKAAQRFDPDRDTRFATYATTSILGELKRHFRDKAWTLRVPRSVQETYLSVKQARDDLTQARGCVPTSSQLAEYLEISKTAVRDALEAGGNFWPTSLDAPDPEGRPVEVPVVDTSFDLALDRLALQRYGPTLDDREQWVLKRIYFDSRTQREVARELEISQMQVSRVLAHALAKLREGA